MISLRCEDCGTVFHSAAARSLVARGERCAACGGRLRIDEPGLEGRVGVGANGPESEEDEEEPGEGETPGEPE